MNSTDHNLNNPLLIDGIDLSREVSSWKSPTVELITQEMYDLLQVKDPLKIYVISDSNDARMYLGDARIPNDRASSKYFVGIDKNTREYLLYMNIPKGSFDMMVPISRYHDPKEAFDALSLYSNAGSHQNIELALYVTIAAFIDSLTNVNDVVIGIMSFLGYKNDPRLQHLIELALSYGAAHSKYDVSPELLDRLTSESSYGNPLFNIYLKIYKTLEKYNFFKDDKYHQGLDKLDLSKPIADIISSAW